MFLTIILSQILTVFCQQRKNVDIQYEVEYDMDGSFENLKFRNVRPISQDIPEEAPVMIPDLESAIRDEGSHTNNDGRFAYRRMNINENPSIGTLMKGQPKIFDSKKERINNGASYLLQVLGEISEFRRELIEEAQQNIRGTSEQANNIKQSELGLRPREVDPINQYRRMDAYDEKINRIHFRKTKEIRGIKNYDPNMSTNSGVSLLPLAYRKRSLEKRTTLSPRDRDRNAATEIYKFLKEVSFSTPKQKKKSTLRLQTTRNIPQITPYEKKIYSRILALSKELDLLASEHKQKSKQVSLRSKKGIDFILPEPDENKTKKLIDIAKAIEFITSKDAKDALSQLSASSLESKVKSSEHIKNPTKSSELTFLSEYFENSNLTEREKRLEIELKKLRQEIDLLTPEKNKKLSTQDVFSFTIRPTKLVSVSSYEYSDTVTVISTTETSKALSTRTKHKTQLDFQLRKLDYSFLKPENGSESVLHKTPEVKSIKDEEGGEISITSNISQDSYNLDTDVTFSASKKQKLEAANKKQSESVIEHFNKLLNLTLLKHLKETNQELTNVKIANPTTVTNLALLRLTKEKPKRPKNMRRTNTLQEKRLHDQRKQSTRKIKSTKESEIDKFRKQLRMEYDSLE